MAVEGTSDQLVNNSYVGIGTLSKQNKVGALPEPYFRSPRKILHVAVDREAENKTLNSLLKTKINVE